jgi:hypothetical protein
VVGAVQPGRVGVAAAAGVADHEFQNRERAIGLPSRRLDGDQVTCRGLQRSALTRLNGEGRNGSGHAGSSPGRTAWGKATCQLGIAYCVPPFPPPSEPAALTAGALGHSGAGCFQPSGLCRYQPLVKLAAIGRICAERYARWQFGGRAVPCLC